MASLKDLSHASEREAACRSRAEYRSFGRRKTVEWTRVRGSGDLRMTPGLGEANPQPISRLVLNSARNPALLPRDHDPHLVRRAGGGLCAHGVLAADEL